MMTSKYLNGKIVFSIFVSLSVVLGFSHHFLNFWGLTLRVQSLILLIVVPIFAFLISLLLYRVWGVCAAIDKTRWLLFLSPAVIAASFMTWQFYVAPSVWHTIEIIPASGHSSGRIELYEIETPRGKAVKFSKIEVFDGWIVENNVLKTVSVNPAPVSFSFFSPVNETISLLFQRSLGSRDVTVILDGKQLEVELYHPDEGLKPVQITTAYKQGVSGGIILFIVAVIDFFAFFFLILFLWLVQEISQIASAAKNKENDEFIFSHKTSLIVLLAFAFLLHTLNFLAAPLIISSDSSSYLGGAIHWMQYHNLDGVSSVRGPGTTFLFIPIFLFFGRNPWGIKMVLHLLAIAAIPLSYRLGWHIFQRRSFAFFAGLIVIFMPEMYLYSNVVMSDIPNVFLGLLFCSLLISALEAFSAKNMITCMLVASFAALTRPENVLLLAIGAGFLFVKIVWERRDSLRRFQILGAATLLAIIPLLGWAAHNNRVHGFFGLSNYADEVLYDGWVYFGEASGFHITDFDSPAVQSIEKVIAIYGMPASTIVAPTGWELYPLLLKYGYTEKQAIQLLGDAARDSIRRDPKLTAQLYLLKLEKSFIPETIMTITFAIPREDRQTTAQPRKGGYFDAEKILFPALIPFQRMAYDSLPKFNQYFYYPLVIFCLGVLFFSVYQKQFFIWMPIIAITASRLFVPITIGLGNWRYIISGLPFLFIFSLLAIQSISGFLSFAINPKTAKYD